MLSFLLSVHVLTILPEIISLICNLYVSIMRKFVNFLVIVFVLLIISILFLIKSPFKLNPSPSILIDLFGILEKNLNLIVKYCY